MTPIPQSLVSLGPYLWSGGQFGSAPAARCRSTGGKLSRISSRRAAGCRCRRARRACPRRYTATRAAGASAARGSPGGGTLVGTLGCAGSRWPRGCPCAHLPLQRSPLPAQEAHGAALPPDLAIPSAGLRVPAATERPRAGPSRQEEAEHGLRGTAPAHTGDTGQTPCHTPGTRGKRPSQAMSFCQLWHVCHK